MADRKLKIAVLFRGPVRPDVSSVVARCSELMTQFQYVQNVDFTTYLATWRTWKNTNASELLKLNLFDNVLMQTQMSEEQIELFTKVKHLPGGHTIRSVWNQYHQCKIALDLITSSDRYDFIIHSRTDIFMQFGQHIQQWFDGGAYTAPHITNAPWMCDQFGIAPANMMHAAWNYGTMEQLGQMVDKADIQERILEWMINAANIPQKAVPYDVWHLDPNRNS